MISNQVGGGYPAGYGEPMEIEAQGQDFNPNTLVMLAAMDTDPSHLSVFQTLVGTAGVELNCRNRAPDERVGLTPLDIVIMTTNFNVGAQRQLARTKVEALLEHGATADTSLLSDTDNDDGLEPRHEPAIVRIGNRAPEITRILIDAHIQEGKIQQLTVHDEPYKGCGLDYAILYATNEQFNNIIAVLKDTIPEEGGLDLEDVVRSAEMAVEGDLPERAARLLASAIKMNVDQHHPDSPIDPYIEDCDEGTLSLMTRLSSRDRLMIAKAAILNDVEYGVELVATMIQATPEKPEDRHKDSLYEEDLFRAEFEEQLVTEVRKKKGAQFDLGVWATNHNDAPVDFRELLVVIGEGVDEGRLQLPDLNSMSHISDG